MSKISKSVDDIIEVARRLQRGANEQYDTVDVDHHLLRAKLEVIAKFRSPTIEDFDRAVAEMEREIEENMRKALELAMRCQERRDDLRVFYVYNTNNRKLTVLARDAACARLFAKGHGHIRDEKNGQVMVMKEEVEAKLRRSGAALGRALRDGYPGVVKHVGRSVISEERNKVYTSMTIVE